MADRGLAPVTLGRSGDRATASTPAVASTSEPKEVHVEVVNGSLEHAGYPVVIGHYTGQTIAGALGYLDRKYGWSVTRRQYLGLLPEAVGEVHTLRLPKYNRPPGAIIVALGASDGLNLGRLTRCTTQASLERLMDVVEQGRSDERIGLSLVLLGTSRPAGLPVPVAVPAILEGVLRANQLVADVFKRQSAGQADPDVANAPYISDVELIELHQDLAEVAARSLSMAFRAERQVSGVQANIRAAAPGFTVVPAVDVRRGEGARPTSPPDDDRTLGWQTLRIKRRDEPASYGSQPEEKASELDFTLIANLAGVGTSTLPVDHAVVDRLLAKAARRSQPNDDVHVALYQLLLPHEIKAPLVGAGNLKLVLDPTVANYPWEMLAARGEGGDVQPLCLQGGFLRQLDLGGRQRVRRRATGKRALVLGNLPGGPRFRSLPGASREARAVADLLGEYDYEVDELIFGPAGEPPQQLADTPSDEWWERVITKVFAHEYQVIHVASHGSFEADAPYHSGVVIGDGRYLTAQAFEQLQIVPDFVFVNCCHLGQVESADGETSGAGGSGPTELSRLAASAARVLMETGVRAVVAAGWAVDDASAETFARSLYRGLLGGQVYGDAVRDARRAIRPGPSSRSSTWGAYQCYGDAGFRLQLSSTHARSMTVATPRRQVSTDAWMRSDLERWLDEVVSEAGDVDSSPSRTQARQSLRERIEGLESMVTDSTRATSAVWYRLGRAYSEIAYYDEAIRCFDAALGGGLSADYPAKLFEEYANLEVRRAQRLFREADSSPRGDVADAIATSFERARRQLDSLERLYSSDELAALWGSYHKKRATTLAGHEQRDAARKALESYGRAVATGKSYQRLNHAQLAFLLDRAQPPDALLEPAAPPDRNDRARREWVDYWDRVGAADRRLTSALAKEELAERLGELQGEYDRVFRERSTWKERDSTIDHLWDLSRLHPMEGERAALCSLWEGLRCRWQD